MTSVAHLVVGPAEHGVVRCALELYAQLGGRGTLLRASSAADAVLLFERAVQGFDLVHVHFTDRLFGPSADAASLAFTDMANTLSARSIPVTVTLHDIPQPSDGAAHSARIGCYQAVVKVSAGAAVSSHHERMLLHENGIETDVAVVPLPFDLRVPRPPYSPPTRQDVGVLGFVYPGKGHVEALRALEGTDSAIGLLAIGTPSHGHDGIVTELEALGRSMGRQVCTTGFIDDAVLGDLLRTIAVPVAYHRHLSASGSINTWIDAGRRPLVPRGRYVEELEARSPGVLWIHDDTERALRGAIATALENPADTWLDAAVDPRPTPQDWADAYRRLFDTWSA